MATLGSFTFVSNQPDTIHSLQSYLDDPEGNTIEIYWATGLSYGQPYGHPIDLSLPEETLLQDISELAARVEVPNTSGAKTG